MRIKATPWVSEVTYDPATGTYAGNDAGIVKYLNAKCVPADAADEQAAFTLVASEFVGVQRVAEPGAPVATDATDDE